MVLSPLNRQEQCASEAFELHRDLLQRVRLSIDAALAEVMALRVHLSETPGLKNCGEVLARELKKAREALEEARCTLAKLGANVRVW